MVDFVSKEKRSYIMSRIRGKWTTPERTLHNYLKGYKIRHTMHPKMHGNPDVLVVGSNLVVFVDGNFWHGKNYRKRKKELPKFWKEKIERNMKRDRKTNRKLRKEGWKVIRLWEYDINNFPKKCIGKILASMKGHKSK